jgi:hypothetical protein
VISALHSKYEKITYLAHQAKNYGMLLRHIFEVSNVGSELYLMEQLYDYKIVKNRSVVEQTHEIQTLAKELEHFSCLLPDKFLVSGIITKLSPSWRDFATSLKHKRQEFSVAELIGSLDVEERARAKDYHGKGVESSTANMV